MHDLLWLSDMQMARRIEPGHLEERVLGPV